MFLAYPYTDLYNLNLDWMIKAIKEVQEVIENLGSVVNTFNEREGDVVLTAADVNNLQIDSVVTLPEGSFDTLTEAQKTAYYEAGKRILVALDAMGEYSKLGFLYKAGATIGMAEYYPTPAEYAVLSFNGRTGQVTLNTNDVNNLDIQPVLQIYGVDISTLTNEQKLQYFDAGIRFIQCIPTQSGTLTTQKLYNLRVQENGDIRTPIVVAYDPLQGQSLVKAVNQSSPNNAGQLYLFADGIDMANDDNDTVYSRITTLEGAAVKSVNGVQPTSGAVTLTGADIAVSANDATKINVKFADYQPIIKDTITYINGALQVDIQATGNVDYITVFNAIYVKLFNTLTTNFASIDATLFVVNQSHRWYLKGFISKPNNSGYLELTIPLIRNTPITAVIRGDTVSLLDGMPSMKDLAYFEQYATATRAYNVGSYVFARDGLRRIIQDTAIGTSLQNATYTEKLDTVGVLNRMQYEELVLSTSDFISGTITDTDFQMSLFRFGPVKMILGRVTITGFDSSQGYIDILNIPSRFRPTRATPLMAFATNSAYNTAISLTPYVLRVFKNANIENLTNFAIRFALVYC